jgi:ribosomal protein L14E/L6E/L27E
MKIFKWIFGLFVAIGGILSIMLVPAGNKIKKIKALDKKINQQKNLQKTLKSKKKALKEIKEKKYKKKDVSTKEASDFLKNFSKEK